MVWAKTGLGLADIPLVAHVGFGVQVVVQFGHLVGFINDHSF